jgi:hypothetical protein
MTCGPPVLERLQAFYVRLTLGDSEIRARPGRGLEVGAPSRVLLSVEVPDVDALLPVVLQACGVVQGPAAD